MEQSDLAAARAGQSTWRGWVVAAALLVSTVGVLFFAAPWLLYVGNAGGGCSYPAGGFDWVAELPAHVSPGELQFTIDATFDEEPPHRAAMLEDIQDWITRYRAGRAGPPIVGRAQLRFSRIDRVKSGHRPFVADDHWRAEVSFQFEGSCDGHPIRCSGDYSASSNMSCTGLVSDDGVDRELAKWFATMVADVLGEAVAKGRR